MHVVRVRAGGNQLGDGMHHGKIGSAEGTDLAQRGIEAVGHHGSGFALRALHGNAGSHGLHRRELPSSAEGHQQAARAVGGVEALGQTALRALI